MKKALLYIATSILLGTVMMVAPLMLLKPTYYALITARDGKNVPAILEALDEGEGTFGEWTLERVASPSNLLSAAVLLIPSFLLALGVSLYLKNRIRAHMPG